MNDLICCWGCSPPPPPENLSQVEVNTFEVQNLFMNHRLATPYTVLRLNLEKVVYPLLIRLKSN